MSQDFLSRMNGRFRGMLYWPQLDALWANVRANPEGLVCQPGRRRAGAATDDCKRTAQLRQRSGCPVAARARIQLLRHRVCR